MNKNLDFVPNPRYMLSLRDHGYKFEEIVRELCDNSCDALSKIKNKRIFIHFNFEEDFMFIADNGCGMTEETLCEALRLGSETGKNSEHGEEFGNYGSGLKAACLSVAKKFMIITKHADGDYLTAVYDSKLGVINNTWNFPEVRLATEGEIAKLQSYAGEETGTYLELNELDKIKNKDSVSVTSATIRKIGEYYRYLISTKKNDDKISFYVLSGKKQKIIKVEPIDPMCVNLNGTDRLNDQETNKYTVNIDGEEVVFYLDFYHVSQEAKDRNGDKTGVNPIEPNVPNQGIYVLRNNRQIVRAKTFEMFTKHNNLNFFRAELRYNSVYDKFFGIDNKKINIDPVQGILDVIRQDVKTFANESFKRTKKETAKNQIGIHDEDINRIYDEDFINPNIPKLRADDNIEPVTDLNGQDGGKTKVPGDKTHEKTGENVGKPQREKTGKGGKHHHLLKNLPYEITYYNDGERGCFFKPIYKGGTKYELRINLDHKFYIDRFSKLDFIGKKALIDIIYSVTLAQYNTLYNIFDKIKDFNGDIDHDDKTSFINNFMESWSDYLKDKIYR